MRPLYVYELDVTIPEDRRWPWTPPGFHEDHGCGSYECEFHWPSRRRFLSATSAKRRADQMRKWGASVVIRRSEPVVFEQVVAP